MSRWAAWEWDWVTAQWTAWAVWFMVLETWALLSNGHLHPLTAHLRPVFQADPLAWFLAFGVWLWLGFHFLVQELWI